MEPDIKSKTDDGYQRGFTFIELLAVLLIMVLIAGYVGPKLTSLIEKSKDKQALEQMQHVVDALELFRRDYGRYPTPKEGLAVLTVECSKHSVWKTPYLKRDLLMDPWGNAYIYRFPGDGKTYDLLSFGADNAQGGCDENADIVA